VDLEQVLGRDVGVALRRRQARVSEQLLDRAQVGAAVEQMGGEGVAERVRAHPAENPALDDPLREELADGARGEPAALAEIQEERALVAAGETAEQRESRHEPGGDRIGAAPAEGRDALLLALAAYGDDPLRQIEVGEG